MFGLQIADIVVLGLYLLGMAAIGVWSARKIKKSADFFMPRQFGKATMVMFGFGAGTHSDQAVGVASKSFTNGLSGIWYQWLWLPCTPFYWLIAPVMSSCDAFMIASSALFTENIYRPIWPDRSQRHYITVGRIAAVAVVFGGVVFAFRLPGVVAGLEIFWKISAMMGLAFWLGLFWRRMTVGGAWATTLIGFFVMLFTSEIAFGEYVLWDFSGHFAKDLPGFMLLEGGLSLPWQMLFYLGAGLISGIAVSLFTKPVSEAKLENFYALTRTPIAPGEQIESPCTLPAGAVVPQRRNVFPNTSLEIAIPSRISIIGFLVGWGFVAAIVYVVYTIAIG